MKYLKSYRIFESNDPTDSEIYLTINDILIELGDIGILTEIVPVDSYDPITFDAIENASYEISIQGDLENSDQYENYYEQIKWNDIEEVVDRLIEYLESKGYNKLSIMVDGSVDREDKKWIEDMKVKGDYEFDSLTLKFSKI